MQFHLSHRVVATIPWDFLPPLRGRLWRSDSDFGSHKHKQLPSHCSDDCSKAHTRDQYAFSSNATARSVPFLLSPNARDDAERLPLFFLTTPDQGAGPSRLSAVTTLALPHLDRENVGFSARKFLQDRGVEPPTARFPLPSKWAYFATGSDNLANPFPTHPSSRKTIRYRPCAPTIPTPDAPNPPQSPSVLSTTHPRFAPLANDDDHRNGGTPIAPRHRLRSLQINPVSSTLDPFPPTAIPPPPNSATTRSHSPI
jgi:hypothetical protein